MLGLERLSNAIGLILMVQGVAMLLGTTLSGFLREATGDYDASFYLAGGCICFGAVFFLPLRYVVNKERENNALDIDV